MENNESEKTSRKNRTDSIKVRIYPEQRLAWQTKANLSGISLSQLICDSTDNVDVKSSEDNALLIGLGTEINKMGNNLNQIARWVNTYKGDAEVGEVIEMLESIQDYLKSLADAN